MSQVSFFVRSPIAWQWSIPWRIVRWEEFHPSRRKSSSALSLYRVIIVECRHERKIREITEARTRISILGVRVDINTLMVGHRDRRACLWFARTLRGVVVTLCARRTATWKSLHVHKHARTCADNIRNVCVCACARDNQIALVQPTVRAAGRSKGGQRGRHPFYMVVVKSWSWGIAKAELSRTDVFSPTTLFPDSRANAARQSARGRAPVASKREFRHEYPESLSSTFPHRTHSPPNFYIHHTCVLCKAEEELLPWEALIYTVDLSIAALKFHWICAIFRWSAECLRHLWSTFLFFRTLLSDRLKFGPKFLPLLSALVPFTSETEVNSISKTRISGMSLIVVAAKDVPLRPLRIVLRICVR